MIDVNHVILQGVLEEAPEQMGVDCGERMYKGKIRVRRGSGVEDILPVMLGEYTLARRLDVLKAGTRVWVSGEIRTYDKGVNGRARHMVFARKLNTEPVGEDRNIVHLTGTICRQMSKMVTPRGREKCEFIAAVNMRNRCAYVPCIAWSRMSDFANALEVGEKVEMQGRLQSRDYIKRRQDGSEETRTVYELSLQRLKLYEGTEVADEHEPI